MDHHLLKEKEVLKTVKGKKETIMVSRRHGSYDTSRDLEEALVKTRDLEHDWYEVNTKFNKAWAICIGVKDGRLAAKRLNELKGDERKRILAQVAQFAEKKKKPKGAEQKSKMSRQVTEAEEFGESMIGKSYKEFKQAARESNMRWRIVIRDGKPIMGGYAQKTGTISVQVDNGIVTKIHNVDR